MELLFVAALLGASVLRDRFLFLATITFLKLGKLSLEAACRVLALLSSAALDLLLELSDLLALIKELLLATLLSLLGGRHYDLPVIGAVGLMLGRVHHYDYLLILIFVFLVDHHIFHLGVIEVLLRYVFGEQGLLAGMTFGQVASLPHHIVPLGLEHTILPISTVIHGLELGIVSVSMVKVVRVVATVTRIVVAVVLVEGVVVVVVVGGLHAVTTLRMRRFKSGQPVA